MPSFADGREGMGNNESASERTSRVRFGSDQAYSQPVYSASQGESLDDEEEGGEHESSGNGEGESTTLAINASRGKFGCCYYSGREGIIYLMEDTEDSAWDLVKTLLEQIQPSLVLTSASADPLFLAALSTNLSLLPSLSSTASTISSEDHTPVKLEYRPPRDFYAGQGKNALAGLRIVEGIEYRDGLGDDDTGDDAYAFGRSTKRRRVGGDDERSRRNDELRLGSFLGGSDNSPLTLGCAGSLISHITREMGANGELDVEANFMVNGLRLLNLDKHMLINHDALVSLQIFDSESHASIHSDQTKEGLSLFGIMNVARTPLGRVLMKQWFLRPSLELEVIKSRQDAVECFLRGENQHVTETIQTNFVSIKNAAKTVKILRSGRGGTRDWQAIWKFIYGAVIIRDAILSLTNRRGVEIVEKLLATIDSSRFQNLGNMMNDIIDWEESSLVSGGVAVKSGVNEDLDELRRTYAGLPDFLSRVAVEISRTMLPELAPTISVVYFPQLGYLIVIPASGEHLSPDEFEVEGWDYQFATEESIYFKSDKTRDLDRHMGDIHSYVADKEIEILHALLDRLVEHEEEICATCEALSELDCLLAFAEVARIYDWNRPRMTEDSLCKIREGRHPLVEIVVDAYVKNDCSLVAGRGVGWDVHLSEEDRDILAAEREEGCLDPNQSMCIVTGANYSGKSIYLKQVALLVYMAHLGSFIPAELALIGLTDKILTRVATRESISRGSSAFMIDLQQISFALRNATSRSLVVIDEFGKGTESDDGAGLFCGVVENLINRGAEAPRVVVATHFQDVIRNQLLSTSLPIAFAHMEIVLTKSATDFQNITYLYQFASGLATSSHASACAALCGIDSKIVNRAEEITNLLASFEIDQIIAQGLSEEEKVDLRSSEIVARRFIEWEIPEEDEVEVEELVTKIREILREDPA